MSSVSESQWSALSGIVAQRTGLHFPPERRADLQRGLAGAAEEFGFGDDAAKCVRWLSSAALGQAQIRTLAAHLTVGETYFFRDPRTLDTIANEILPALIAARRGRIQHLRLWSAACCTGEEAYSLAILLHRLLPDLPDWEVSVLATDLNPCFLAKAEAGVYGAWSFRDTPPCLKQRYFSRTADGRFAVVPEIMRLVTFAPLNLVDEVFPSVTTGIHDMDVIFCRNVLMYFTPEQIAKVIDRLHRSLGEGGWLAVSPSESSQSLFPQFAVIRYPGTTLFRKTFEALQGKLSPDRTQAPLPAARFDPLAQPGSSELAHPSAPVSLDVAIEPFPGVAAGAQPVDAPAGIAGTGTADALACSRQARALADEGRLAESQQWCERWIGAAKLDPAAYYLQGVVALEQGDVEQARSSLQRVVYLDGGCVLAHVALGNIARGRGRRGEETKHFANALQLLRGMPPEAIVVESEGLTAGRLAETIATMTGGALRR